MIIEKAIDMDFGVNTYIVGDEKTRKCIVIDPGAKVEDILNILAEKSLKVEYIVLTHGHGDHIGRVIKLVERTGVKVVAHKDEEEILLDEKKNLSYRMPYGPQAFKADIYVNDKDKLSVGDMKLTFIHTPGHTKGSMCIRIDNHMFTGDTLFAGSIGRTDLYGGDYNQMEKSLKKLSKYENELFVYPGHGPSTTLGVEKNTNPYM